jgi:hypothetical protein
LFQGIKFVIIKAGLASLTGMYEYLNEQGKLQGEYQLITELYNNITTFKIKLSLFYSQLSNSFCHFTNRKYFINIRRMEVGMSVTLNNSSSHFVDFEQDRALFRTFSNQLEYHEDAESSLQCSQLSTYSAVAN